VYIILYCTVVTQANCVADVLESKNNKKLPENTKQLKKESKDLLKEVSGIAMYINYFNPSCVDTIKVCKCEEKIINKYQRTCFNIQIMLY